MQKQPQMDLLSSTIDAYLSVYYSMSEGTTTNAMEYRINNTT
jgi:hypothetical protein